MALPLLKVILAKTEVKQRDCILCNLLFDMLLNDRHVCRDEQHSNAPINCKQHSLVKHVYTDVCGPVCRPVLLVA